MINESFVRSLIATQFPQWKDLPIRPVMHQGWDNRTFHLGDDILVRMPSAAHYASQVEKEQRWLPLLAQFLPLPVPAPIAIGEPGEGYPWRWSVLRWIEGEHATTFNINNLTDFARNLAKFLAALQSIESKGGPAAGEHSFYRGGPLNTYDRETREALIKLSGKIDVPLATEIWESALETSWQQDPVWIHGDIAASNLLVKDGQLCAVIDFGQLAIGDPACDLVIAWTLFEDESRKIFRSMLSLDNDTWARARGWALWKSLIVLAGMTEWNAGETTKHLQIINALFADYNSRNKEIES